jgi:hypothetical protein
LATTNVVRIYLTSQVRIEHGETLVGERDLPGRQGHVALALLVAERDRPVTGTSWPKSYGWSIRRRRGRRRSWPW